ncbi:MAG: substrate-binding domain-containing protein [Anaerolineae bacterium]
MRSGKNLIILTLLALLMATAPRPVRANPSPQAGVTCEEVVFVQVDDWLSKIADKVYGDVFAYPAIAEATNARHRQDSSFANIQNVDLIEPGWKLCIPSAAEAEALLNRTLRGPDLAPTPPARRAEVGRLVLATTTSTDDSGLLKAILPDFEARYGASVEVIAVGTGQAIQLGENGDADVILVHARELEDAFVEAGFGINRQDVMYNDFVIAGPASDPAGVAGMADAIAALTKIAETQSVFVSRGDDSGTHTKEQNLWRATTVPLSEIPSLKRAGKTNIRPTGDWYLSVGQGMGATLTMADQQQAYTLSDRATYLARKQEGLGLEILVEGDSRLFNPYGVIAVNPDRYPNVNAAGATAFIEWLTSLETQRLISRFGVETFGMPLFVPNATAWKAAK